MRTETLIPFATEFPVTPIATKAAFIGEVVGWLRGSTYSQVLASAEPDLAGDFAFLQSPNGEELRFREFKDDGGDAIGFRHDYGDGEGRIWRTEGVLKNGGVAKTGGIVRLSTQCLAGKSGALLESPRKPYLIKAVLQDGWGGDDGWLQVMDRPHMLADDEEGLFLARALVQGEATIHLPVIYVSTTSRKK